MLSTPHNIIIAERTRSKWFLSDAPSNVRTNPQVGHAQTDGAPFGTQGHTVGPSSVDSRPSSKSTSLSATCDCARADALLPSLHWPPQGLAKQNFAQARTKSHSPLPLGKGATSQRNRQRKPQSRLKVPKLLQRLRRVHALFVRRQKATSSSLFSNNRRMSAASNHPLTTSKQRHSCGLLEGQNP